jgi:Holliday junction resolvasome RuvABC endonuclease subunit
MMHYNRLIAIDPSLTCTGWAMFSLNDGVLRGVGKIKSLPPATPMAERLLRLQLRIAELMESLHLGERDILVCEGQTSMLDPKAAIKVEQVRGIFEVLARQRGVLVPGRVNPRSVQKELLNFRGAQQKRYDVKIAACRVVKSVFEEQLKAIGFDTLFKNFIKHQDITDAILVGSLAVIRVRDAKNAKVKIADLFAENRSKGKRYAYKGWGAGGDNSLGWSDTDLEKLAGGMR